ncbi:MAG: LysR family transcriptional regulator [Rhizobiales bacterium]|nr:LysR family transcriptional regulator [Hyphomicrobiales bacterium]
MLRQLPLGALRAFEAAARTGSFRAAGEELAISASAISHAIRKLEDLIGAGLFEREGRAVRLNAAGETLLRHVASGFEELRHGLEVVSARQMNLLRLHCAPSLAAQWLLPRLPRLIADAPGLTVRLSAGTDYPKFHADEFDADIRYGRPRAEGLAALPLGEETVTPLCAPALAARLRTPADLYDLELIESDNKQVRWTDWFAANGLRAPSPRGSRFDRSFMAIAAAADGLGVALESTRLAERELDAGRLVAPLRECSVDIRYVGHFLVYPPRARSNRALRTFETWLFAQLGLTRG